MKNGDIHSNYEMVYAREREKKLRRRERLCVMHLYQRNGENYIVRIWQTKRKVLK
jgi:hypothetical protein